MQRFFNKYSHDFFSKAIQKHETTSSTISDRSIQYYQALQQLLQELIAAKVIIRNHEQVSMRIQTLLDAHTKTYLSAQNNALLEASYEQAFRRAFEHAEAILRYDPDHQLAQTLKQEAFLKAKKTASLAPFFSYANPLSPRLKKKSGSSSSQNKRRKTDTMLLGINITHSCTEKTRAFLEKEKSIFLVILNQDKVTNNYLVSCELAVKETDTQRFPEVKQIVSQAHYKTENSPYYKLGPFEYEIHESRYKIQIMARITITNKATTSVSTIQVQDSAEQLITQPGSIIREPDFATEIDYPIAYKKLNDITLPVRKEIILEEAMDRISKKIASTILVELDQKNAH